MNEIKFVPKGWGFEKWIVNKPQYCGKLLYMAKGRRCSFHKHRVKDEVFYLQSGKVLLRYTDDWEKIQEVLPVSGRNWEDLCDSVILGQGDSFHVPPGRVHQMVALEDSELFEFSTEHFEEDSIRIVKGD